MNYNQDISQYFTFESGVNPIYLYAASKTPSLICFYTSLSPTKN